VTSGVTGSDSRLEMKRLFNLYDDKREGVLTREKLRQIAEEYGMWITNEELELMVKSANETGNVTE
jgi:Ca2+-binding EF-hand superfamily protein